MHPRIETLLGFLAQAWGPKAWHGTALKGAVRGVSWKEAQWRPKPGRHNIWELVLHMAYWKYTVVRRLGDAPRGGFPRDGSDWIPVEDASEAGWKADIALLHDQHARLVETVENFPIERLDTKEGSKYTNAEHIMGIAAHDLYHTGQLQLIKKLASAKVAAR
jgi:uncharacterized damage-inducible protein DinB